jgi:leader peptidase (prepilin peptidase)/N-methyltransferase
LRVAKGQQFAFGPSLAVAGWLVFIANEKVLAALGWWLRASGFSA